MSVITKKRGKFDDQLMNKIIHIIEQSKWSLLMSRQMVFEVENNDKDPKSKVEDHERISKYKNIFTKGYIPNWSEVFVIKKVKNTIP